MKKLEFENKEQEKLFEDNKGLAIKIAIDWSKKCEIEFEELKSYALQSLCIAAIRYDVNKCDRFTNYAAVVINMNIRRELKARNTKKRKAEKKCTSFNYDVYESLRCPEETERYMDLLLSMDQILSEFPSIQREVVKKYLIDRMTLNELAEEYSMSMRTVHKWVLKGKEELRLGLSC